MADEIKYGLSREGFRRKRLPEIISSMNSRLADRLGVEIQTGSNSLFGQLVGVFAYEIADLWEMAQDSYNAMYPNTASGVSLSNAAGLAGISLIEPEYSTVIATCYGSNGAAVPYGSQITSSAADATSWTSTEANVYISASRACYARIEADTIAEGKVYSLTVAGQQKTYTAKAKDDNTAVLTALAAQFSLSHVSFSLSNDVLQISSDAPQTTFAIKVSNLIITRLGSPVTFKCDTAGAIDPVIGTLTQITTAYDGWTGVSNNASAYVGRDAESDVSLRQRWSSSLYDRASAMIEAIVAAVYANVDGVLTCRGYTNDTDIKDAEGRPPHSIEIVVDGGEPDAIAKQIWRNKAGGIDTFGSMSGIVVDSQGVQRTMNFNRPEAIKVWLKVTIGMNPDEVLPPAAETEIAADLLAKGQTQSIGEDVILQRYFATVFAATTGVGYINLTACTGDTAGTYTTDNISINDRQIAVFDASRIEVTKQ